MLKIITYDGTKVIFLIFN